MGILTLRPFAIIGGASNWRLLIETSQGTTYTYLGDLIIRNQADGPNLLSNGTATASSTFNAINVAANAFDNNSSTYWQSGSGQLINQWVAYLNPFAIDPASIVEFVMRTAPIVAGPQLFHLQYSTNGGGNWITLRTGELRTVEPGGGSVSPHASWDYIIQIDPNKAVFDYTRAGYNPSFSSVGALISGGNLTATGHGVSIIDKTKLSGRYQFEFTITSSTGGVSLTNVSFGLTSSDTRLNSGFVGSTALASECYGIFPNSSSSIIYKNYIRAGVSHNGGYGWPSGSFNVGDVITMVWDVDKGVLFWWVNGQWRGQLFSGITAGNVFPAVGTYLTSGQTTTVEANMGRTPFSMTLQMGAQPYDYVPSVSHGVDSTQYEYVRFQVNSVNGDNVVNIAELKIRGRNQEEVLSNGIWTASQYNSGASVLPSTMQDGSSSTYYFGATAFEMPILLDYRVPASQFTAEPVTVMIMPYTGRPTAAPASVTILKSNNGIDYTELQTYTTRYPGGTAYATKVISQIIPYAGEVKALLHMEDSSFPDSMNLRTMTPSNGATHESTTGPTGAGCVYLPSLAKLTSEENSDFGCSSGDSMTFEFYVKPESFTGGSTEYIAGLFPNGGQGIGAAYVYTTESGIVHAYVHGVTLTGVTLLQVGVWSHIAISINPDYWFLSIDGKTVFGTRSSTWSVPTRRMILGTATTLASSAIYALPCRISEVRYSKGVCLYPGDYDLQTIPYPMPS